MQFYGAKIHIILYKNKRFRQKVKIVTLFVKPYYGKIILTLQSKGSTVKMLTLGIAQASLALHSLNRDLVIRL